MENWHYLCIDGDCLNKTTAGRTRCQPCYDRYIARKGFKSATPRWMSEWGHWKKPGDLLCRCCHDEEALIDAPWELKGAL